MRTLILFLILLSAFNLHSQTPADTVWTKAIGGSSFDPPNTFPRANPKVVMNSDGDIYIFTSTQSNDGWVNNNIGSSDCWLIKMNSAGDTLWTKVFGGTNLDKAKSIIALSDGGCAVTGSTYSNDFNFIGNHDSNGSFRDGFITRFDTDGHISWTKLYGGSGSGGVGGTDFFNKIIVNNSGNLVVVGQTNSVNGDLTWNPDLFYVGWFLEVNPNNGDIITNKKVAGYNYNDNSANELTDICSLSDGTGYMGFGAHTYFVSDHFWLAKLDLNADTVLTKEYDCENFNNSIAIVQDIDGGFIFTGTIDNNGGDVNTHIGSYDIWIVKTDENGEIINQLTFGGTAPDVPYSIKPDNRGNWFITAQTRSNDIFAPGGYGETDFLLINFNSNLDTIFTNRMGGTLFESLTDVVATENGNSYFGVGRTNSNDVFIHDNNGEFDVWVSKIEREPLTIQTVNNKRNNIYCFPNPSTGYFSLKNLNVGTYNIKIYDIYGRIVYKNKNYYSEKKIELHKKGIYFITFESLKNNFAKIIIR